MNAEQSLNHTRWECKYHVVFIPKCRRKALYGRLRKGLSEVRIQPQPLRSWLGGTSSGRTRVGVELSKTQSGSHAKPQAPK